MIVYTDDLEHALKLFPESGPWRTAGFRKFDTALKILAERLYMQRSFQETGMAGAGMWSAAFFVKKASRSHYDLLIDLSRRNCDLPDGVLCLAGESTKFHGQRGRSWSAVRGNIHLAVFLAPRRTVVQFGTGFSILSAVSIVETIDRIPGFEKRAGIKWVNDILIDGAKVAGFLAFAQSRGETVEDVVLGIGLNVETIPPVKRDPLVPRVSSLLRFAPFPEECRQSLILQNLLERLDTNYSRLLKGDYAGLLDIYRRRSLVTGRKVVVFSDPAQGKPKEMARGRVKEIGPNLELFLEGINRPVVSGRLIFQS